MQIKKRLIALGLAGVIIGTVGCADNKNKEPNRTSIPQEYSRIENYYKYVMKDGKAVKVYYSENIYLLYDKNTYEVKEYIFKNGVTWFGGGELYDLDTEEMLVYSNGVASTNKDFFDYLVENNYQVHLTDVSDYIEGYDVKECYSLDEIRELEQQITNSLIVINKTKIKTK